MTTLGRMTLGRGTNTVTMRMACAFQRQRINYRIYYTFAVMFALSKGADLNKEDT